MRKPETFRGSSMGGVFPVCSLIAGTSEQLCRGHEDAALMGSGSASTELCIDPERLSKQCDLRPERQVAGRPEDDVSRLHRAAKTLADPRLDGEIVSGIVTDQIDAFALAAEFRLLGAENTLGRRPANTRDVRLVKQIRVKHLAGRFRRQKGGRDVGERILRHDHQIGTDSAETDGHAGFDATHHDNTREHDGAADRHRCDKQARSRLATANILQREAAEQPVLEHSASGLIHRTERFRVRERRRRRSCFQSHSVQERVCFICASSVGTITQSWWPPVLGRMPIKVSVAVSITAMPLDRRWKPLNGTKTYLPS